MIDTAIAQLRFATALLLGQPCPLWALERLVAGARAARDEFGAVGSAGADLLGGPGLDEEARRAMQLRWFRVQAVRAAGETDYYRDLFTSLGLNPARMRAADIASLPPTSQEMLGDDPDAFVRRTAHPTLRTTTTGTTGRPTSVSFSTREIEATSARTALSLLVHGQMDADDIVQISTSARATLGNTCFAGACTRIGALWYLTGLIEPAHALALLAEEHHCAGKKPRASVLDTYPSYLGQLVECGRLRGYGPGDFGLERIIVGGEIVTEGLKERCRRLFGPVEFMQGYAMTETWPLNGTRCAHGHLHFEPSQGLVEVLDLETGAAAQAGQAGTLVITPFAAYRDATVLLRYDTGDVVRALAEPLTCAQRSVLPATSDLVGKLRQSVHHTEGWTFPREVRAALEACEAVPLPARCGFWAVSGGVAVEAVVRADTTQVRRAITHGLEEQGVPVRALHLVRDPAQLRSPLPLRCDLRETLFAAITALSRTAQ